MAENFAEKTVLFILSKDPITMLVYIYCILLIYIIIYILINLYLITMILFYYPIPVFPFLIIPEVIAGPLYFVMTVIFIFVMMIFGLLTGIFLILYGIWTTAKAIGMHIFLYLFFPPFREASDLGLFNFFDGMRGVVFGNRNVGEKMGDSLYVTFDFLKTFMHALFGTTFEGYDLNDEYADAVFDSKFKKDDISEERQKQIDDILKNQTPIIKIQQFSSKPVKQLTETDVMKINNCVKNNTVEIPKDKNTMDTLMMMIYNEIGKSNCEQNFDDEINSKNPLAVTSGSIDDILTSFNENMKKWNDSLKDDSSE